MYKICILTAGLGTRIRDFFSLSNKALLPIHSKAAISHIIETINPKIEIVIAVGYKAEDVIEYIKHAHPNRSIEFVHIDPFDGPGSGPGLSLYQCRSKLNCPFIVWTVDTLLTNGKMPTVSCEYTDWVGVNLVPDVKRFCKVLVSNDNMVVKYEDKCSNGPGYVFVGIAGIKNYKDFFKTLGGAVSAGVELQISHGLSVLKSKAVVIDDWKDVGVKEECLQIAEGFFNFAKPDEITYDVGGRIIKLYSNNERVASKAHNYSVLKKVCPDNLLVGSHMISYPKVSGSTMYDRLDVGLSIKLYEWAAKELWIKKKLENLDDFYQACEAMYKNKTISRLGLTIKNQPNLQKNKCYINGVLIDSYKNLFAKIDWAKLCTASIPTHIHGDLQFDNIIVTNGDKFVTIDWRENFGGLDYGDVYYDLAKLLSGMTIPYEAIKRNAFSIKKIAYDDYTFNVETSLVLNECRQEFYKFLRHNGYDIERVKKLRALIFAGMSGLHFPPFNELLFYAGRYYLQRAIV